MRQITVLGATGSIGVSTLDVVARHPERFQVFALTAHRQLDKLREQCLQFHPRYAVLGDEALAAQLQQQLREHGLSTEVLAGEAGLVAVASHPDVDTVMAAIVGAAGLPSSFAAAQVGKRVLLANKETLVLAGKLFMDAVQASGAQLLPIDSEHNAIFQTLPRDYRNALVREHPRSHGIRRILLTASGGPFRDRDPATLHEVTPEQACAHPNWSMGRKISVDSATMMNKGLEVIEAHWLFSTPVELIDVVIHPQSIVHSMVEYLDGSILAQLGSPDMRTPIAYALDYPQRIEAGVSPLEFGKFGALNFYPPDLQRFPCLRLAFDALRAAGAMPAVLNAANEVAVEAFLSCRIRFTDIARLVETTLEHYQPAAPNDMESTLAVDAEARRQAMVQMKVLAC
ncbi:1-deoxy-D-xylulose-5-phosphate reductoisomerase [Leeia sp.]|uniref:1-deoxy-D-xylulose-5-phosphate reductoisomerase n=1 Tax=Leeia sp. TaxID=2884678 RepID=UPI0035B2ACD5